MFLESIPNAAQRVLTPISQEARRGGARRLLWMVAGRTLVGHAHADVAHRVPGAGRHGPAA